MSVENDLWVEKYRPQTIDECLLSSELKQKFKGFIEKEEIPNLLLHSRSAGTGKTTIAKILSKAISEDILWINASLERGIDVIRTQVENHCVTMSFDSNYKIIVCEEFDNVTDDAQKALRELIERHSDSVRFIFTCNYINKILEPVNEYFDKNPDNFEKMKKLGIITV